MMILMKKMRKMLNLAYLGDALLHVSCGKKRHFNMRYAVVPILLIALAVQFSYSFLCHAPGEDKICLMDCCKKSCHYADENGEKPEDCCVYRDSGSQNFLVSKVLLLSFTEMEAPLPVRLFAAFRPIKLTNVEREFARYGPSPPLYILKQSFLL